MGKIVGLTFKVDTEKFACPNCGKEYKTAKGLAEHIEKEHPDDKAE